MCFDNESIQAGPMLGLLCFGCVFLKTSSWCPGQMSSMRLVFGNQRCSPSLHSELKCSENTISSASYLYTSLQVTHTREGLGLGCPWLCLLLASGAPHLGLVGWSEEGHWARLLSTGGPSLSPAPCAPRWSAGKTWPGSLPRFWSLPFICGFPSKPSQGRVRNTPRAPRESPLVSHSSVHLKDQQQDLKKS